MAAAVNDKAHDPAAELLHYQRQVKLHVQIIKEQKQKIERSASKLKTVEKALKVRQKEVDKLQEENAALRKAQKQQEVEDNNSMAATKTNDESDEDDGEEETLVNDKDEEWLEKELEARIIARLASEKKQWDMFRKIEEAAQVRKAMQVPTADAMDSLEALSTSDGTAAHQIGGEEKEQQVQPTEEKKARPSSDDVNETELTTATDDSSAAPPAADMARSVKEVSAGAKALARYATTAHEKNDLTSSSREDQEAMAALLYMNGTVDSTKLASMSGRNAHILKLMELQKQIQGLRQSFQQTRQDVIMLKAAVVESDVVQSDVLVAVQSYVGQANQQEARLREFMHFFKQV